MGLAPLEMSGVSFFFYGTLRHPPLLRTVLGRDPAARPARLPGHAVHWAEGEAFPMIRPDPGAEAEGLLAEGLTAEDVARLDFYEGGFACHTREVALEGGAVAARVYFADPGAWESGAPWRLSDWQARWGEIATEAAGDFMRLYGHADPAEILARYPLMLIRAASRVRARDAAPARLRRSAGAGDVEVAAYRLPYAKFFALEEYDLGFRRFDGSMHRRVTRAAFVSGDAAVVLPYDPVRDRVLLVEQFRTGPFARGDAHPWVLEPVAGRVDAGETPEEAARREAVEEAWIAIGRMLAGPRFYPSPGAKSEYLYTFVGLADLPDGAAGQGGLATEDEDIRAHLLSFEALMELVESGEADNGPLIVLALWLARERARIRAAASGA